MCPTEPRVSVVDHPHGVVSDNQRHDELPINTMDFILRSSHTLSHVQNNKWPYGPARLGRLPVKEEIAGSNPVRVATPGGAQQAWGQLAHNSIGRVIRC